MVTPAIALSDLLPMTEGILMMMGGSGVLMFSSCRV